MKLVEVRYNMAKDQTLFQLLWSILSFIFARKKKKTIKQRQKAKSAAENLEKQYKEIDEKKKQRKTKDVKDASNQLNRRF